MGSYRPEDVTNTTAPDTGSSDEYEDEELEAAAAAANRAQEQRRHFAGQRSDSIGCSEDSEDEELNSWSNKKFVKRLMNGAVDYDMMRTTGASETADTASMVDEKDDECLGRDDQRYHQTNENMDNGAAVFHSSRAASKPSLNSENAEEEQRREWMRVMQQQQQQMSQNGHRPKPNFDDRHATKEPPAFDDRAPPEYPFPPASGPYPEVREKHFNPGGGVPAPEKTKPAEKPSAQHQRQPKTLTFAPQAPTAADGRPPLPLDAKKLQQQQKAQEKKRRFPMEDLSDAKKGKKVESKSAEE